MIFLFILLVNCTIVGYTALHFAACWGHLPCLEALVESGAKLDCRTKHGETPRQLALRYNKTTSVDYLDWAGECQCR